MNLPADFRAHRIALAADVISRELDAFNLADDLTAKVRRLLDQIRDDASALRDELAPAVSPPAAADYGNVVYLRRR